MHELGSKVGNFTPDTLSAEAERISEWWCQHGWCPERRRFLGLVSNQNLGDATSEVGIVLMTRILWFFSEAGKTCGFPNAEEMADRAFDQLYSDFVDRQFGGLVWSVHADGQIKESSKKTYAQAFGIYAACAYFRLSGNLKAKQLALALFKILEEKCRDAAHGGYLEGFGRDWAPANDLRLSEVDLQAPKSMNTHLHVLEAYSALHSCFEDQESSAALKATIDIFFKHIIDADHKYLHQFFEADWQIIPTSISHGHDIEASWLLWKAVEAANCEIRKKTAASIIGKMVEHCHKVATLPSGAIINETHLGGIRDERSVWWVQAEGLVGFLNAYEVFGKREYLEAAGACWQFIVDNHIDRQYGEWRWTAHKETDLSTRSYKAGPWKGPYHNGRAMIEGFVRLKRLRQKGRFSDCGTPLEDKVASPVSP